MQNKQKEILAALELIKQTCNEHIDNHCKECPLYSVSAGCCVFDEDENPDFWELNTPDRPWHAVF